LRDRVHAGSVARDATARVLSSHRVRPSIASEAAPFGSVASCALWSALPMRDVAVIVVLGGGLLGVLCWDDGRALRRLYHQLRADGHTRWTAMAFTGVMAVFGFLLL
jgi:hypothetical protein